MSNLTPTGRSTTCPVCGDTTGKCRISRDENLVLCLPSAGDNWHVSGYKAVGDTKCGTWAKYRRCDDTYDPAIAARKRQEWQTRERERIAALPSLDTRHAAIAQKLQRSLTAEHHTKLRTRGLSDEAIDRYGFYSFQGGIAGAVRGIAGGYIATVYRLDKPNDGGRYRWGKDSQLPGSGELPVAVYQPAKVANAGVLYLCEGSIIKPAIAAERLQATVIGYGGGSGDLTRIAPQLRAFCAEFQPREIRILPDAGYRANPQVSRASESLVEICQALAPTRIGDWGQADDKSIGDIDEISDDALAAIQWQSSEQFERQQAKARAADRDTLKRIETAAKKVKAKGNEPIPFQSQRDTQAWLNWRAAKQFTPDITVEQPYLRLQMEIDNLILAVKSGTGTGKTTEILRLIKELWSDSGIIFIGYRNSLLLQILAKLEATLPDRDAYHLQRDLKGDGGEALALIRDVRSIIFCCIDSLIRFEPQDFDGRIIVMDESVSIIAHTLESSTAVARHRPRIKHLLAEAVKRSRAVIMLDGHNNDRDVKYFADLADGTKRVRKIENTYTGNKGTLQILAGTVSPQEVKAAETEERLPALKERDYSPIQAAILANPQRIAIGSDSQTKIEILDRLLTANGRKTLRFDSTTSNSEWADEFLADPSAYLQAHQIDVLLYSPSAEAGLDINLQGYFQDLYFLFFGVLGVDAALQTIARVRDPQARKSVYIAPKGMGKHRLTDETVGERIAAELGAYALNCASESFEGDSEEWISQAIKHVLSEAYDRHFRHETELIGIRNFESDHLREAFIEAATRSGYDCQLTIGEPDDDERGRADEEREAIRTEKSEAIANARDITDREADDISGNFAASDGDKLALKKHRLTKQFPGIADATQTVEVEDKTTGETQIEERPVFDADLVKQLEYEKPQTAKRYELRWLAQNLDSARKMQRQGWIAKLEKAFDPDKPRGLNLAKYRSPLLAAKAIVDIGLMKFLEPEFEWTKDSPEVAAVYECVRSSKRLQRDLGINPGSDKPLAIVGRLLAKLGVRTQRIGNAKARRYRVAVESSVERALFDATARRLTRKLESQRTIQVARENYERTLEKEAGETYHLPPDSIDKLAEGGTSEARLRKEHSDFGEKSELSQNRAEKARDRQGAIAAIVGAVRRKPRPIAALESWILRCADKFGDVTLFGDALEALATANLLPDPAS